MVSVDVKQHCTLLATRPRETTMHASPRRRSRYSRREARHAEWWRTDTLSWMSLPSLVGKPRSWLVDAVSVSPSHVQHISQQLPLPSWPCGLRLKQSFIDLIDPVYRTWAKGAQRIKPVCYWTSFKQRWDFFGLFLFSPSLSPPLCSIVCIEEVGFWLFSLSFQV